MNNVTLVGRLATEPRLEETNGNPICTFRLAVDRGKTEGADFIPIKCFGTPPNNTTSTSPKAAWSRSPAGSATPSGRTRKPATPESATKSSATTSATWISPRPMPASPPRSSPERSPSREAVDRSRLQASTDRFAQSGPKMWWISPGLIHWSPVVAFVLPDLRKRRPALSIANR